MSGGDSCYSLVYAPNWVGDTVMALPVIESLAQSGREITVLARKHLLPLLELAPAVAHTLEAKDDAATTADLRQGGYDEAVLLPNSFRSAWRVRRAGIPRRWGYPGGLRRPLLAPSVPRPALGPQVEDYTNLLAAMEVPTPTDWTPRLPVSEDLRLRGRDLLSRAGLDPDGGPIVGLFAGAEFGPSKQWPRERFEEAARQLRRRRSDLQITIIAGPKEAWLAVRLHEETGKIHPVLGTDLDLADLAAVLSWHRGLLTNDSGPMHLAAAVGVRCAAIFGPTDPERTAPSGTGHQVLTADRWCSPCFRRRCPLLHHKCMTAIEASDAVDTVLGMVDQADR